MRAINDSRIRGVALNVTLTFTGMRRGIRLCLRVIYKLIQKSCNPQNCLLLCYDNNLLYGLHEFWITLHNKLESTIGCYVSKRRKQNSVFLFAPTIQNQVRGIHVLKIFLRHQSTYRESPFPDSRFLDGYTQCTRRNNSFIGDV